MKVDKVLIETKECTVVWCIVTSLFWSGLIFSFHHFLQQSFPILPFYSTPLFSSFISTSSLHFIPTPKSVFASVPSQDILPQSSPTVTFFLSFPFPFLIHPRLLLPTQLSRLDPLPASLLSFPIYFFINLSCPTFHSTFSFTLPF